MDNADKIDDKSSSGILIRKFVALSLGISVLIFCFLTLTGIAVVGQPSEPAQCLVRMNSAWAEGIEIDSGVDSTSLNSSQFPGGESVCVFYGNDSLLSLRLNSKNANFRLPLRSPDVESLRFFLTSSASEIFYARRPAFPASPLHFPVVLKRVQPVRAGPLC